MTFNQWFLDQHGKRPSIKPLHQLVTESDKARAAFNAANALLRECEEYDRRMTSARWAWQARD